MNYSAIYGRFILDRRTIECALRASDTYTEAHHVVPRAHGGDDMPANIIRLTPEDHFFAHLLLAKIYGGSMWWGLMMMASVSGTRRGMTPAKVARMRRHYAAVRRALSRSGNVLFNPTVFRWKNLDTGETAELCLYDMHALHGGTRPTWTSVVSGDRKTYRGWTLADREVRIRGLKGKVFDFVNRDGRAFRGTQLDFCAMADLTASSATRVVRSQSVTRCGWRLQGTDDRSHNAPKDGGRPGKKGGVIVLERGGERLIGDRVEIARLLGTTAAHVSASVYAIRAGKCSTFKGYRLAA